MLLTKYYNLLKLFVFANIGGRLRRFVPHFFLDFSRKQDFFPLDKIRLCFLPVCFFLTTGIPSRRGQFPPGRDGTGHKSIKKSKICDFGGVKV